MGYMHIHIQDLITILGNSMFNLLKEDYSPKVLAFQLSRLRPPSYQHLGDVRGVPGAQQVGKMMAPLLVGARGFLGGGLLFRCMVQGKVLYTPPCGERLDELHGLARQVLQFTAPALRGSGNAFQGDVRGCHDIV